jgi:hypothetical protein
MRQVVQPDERGAEDATEKLRRQVRSHPREISRAHRETQRNRWIEVRIIAPASDGGEDPAITANAHPAAMTGQPPPSAFERLSNTPATTPLPRSTSIIVPRNSPRTGEVMQSLH